MGWFKRKSQGIFTDSKSKKDVPEGLWYKCPNCKHLVPKEEHEKNDSVCAHCDYHTRISSLQYFSILFDNNKYVEVNKELQSLDPLSFQDTKKYSDRLSKAKLETSFNEAISTAYGKLNNQMIAIAVMNFEFIGGSISSAVGEKICRIIKLAIKKKMPLLIISKSGGARMMEAAFSLMQLAKTSGYLSLLSKEKIPYISLLTDPTFGGATASFSMLGDINIAEPNALIGFAGPRVVKETIGKDLPEGFQRSEFLLEKGFLDFIVHRNDLKEKISKFINMVYY
ncbi:MAG: acetyl-CoA carboxylase carboxyl transferase subunit beta [Flavobacteriales bacterium]|jgi:acetyl-CoA carboxylase carboxyl transferase subunit beta|nr:acetyl-CoA carboxylase carboxyl transferase subunit beta [Flavobacteriales bacterium]|tara:strand:+ start:1444 stop:2289 length:846 start_codon:yes stop_codon:yes gene_type:complete